MKNLFRNIALLAAVVLPLATWGQSYQSVPYTTGFEGLSTGDQPTGWVAYESVTTSLATFPCAYNWSGNARNGSVYYEFEFSSGSAVRTLLAATCEFADPSNLMVDFYASTIASYAPTLFEVGVMEDTVFVPVDTVTLTNAGSFSSSSYYHYRVYLVEYTGTGHRIAFRAYKSGTGQMTLFLDDLTVSTAPTCAYMPGTPSATVDSNSATLTWSAPSVSAGYFIYMNNDSSWYYSSTNSYSFYALNPNTQYSGYIYNTCNGSDTSEAVPFSFRTACGMTVLPLVEDFESGGSVPPCWTITESTGSYPTVYSSYAHNGSHCFRMYSTGTYQSLASPLIYTDLNLLQVKFWARKSSTYYTSAFAVGYTTSLDSAANAVWVDTVDLGTDYTEYLYQFENAPSANGYIIFRKTTYSGDYGSIYIDDIEISLAPSCTSMPGTPVVDAVDSNSATLHWNSAAAGGYYALYVQEDNTWFNVYDTSYTITGLTPNTPYSGRLYNICLSGDTSNCTYFSFRTSCGATQLPLVEDFDSYGGEFPSCWRVTESSGTYPYVSSSAGRSGYGLYNYASSTNLSIASPRIEQPINTIETKFWARETGNDNMRVAVGYVTNLDSVSTSAVWVDTLYLTTDWAEYTTSFAHLTTGDTGHVVYRKLSGGYNYVYIDDITIREIRNCGYPDDFVSTGTASGSMSLAWSDSLGSMWEVVYGPAGINPDTVLTNTQTTTIPSITIIGLEDSITYDFYVRSLCSGESSYWQGPITARPNLYVMTANAADTVSMCGGTIVDDGGLDGNYSYSQNSTLVVYPTDNTQTIRVRGSYHTYSSDPYYGQLTIYEGVGTTGRVLGSFSGQDTLNVASLQGAVTITFVSTGYSSYYTSTGYELGLSCEPMASCNPVYNVEVTGVAGASATVNWQYGTLVTPQSFTVTVTDTALGASTSYTVADTVRSYQLSGLTQTTTYLVTVTANCTGTDVSNPEGVYFTTTCYVGGELQVGNGNANASSYPINTYYNYTLCQILYDNVTVSSLTDTIFGVKLYQSSGPNTTRDVVIYLDTTSRASLNGNSDYVAMDSSKIVYSGSHNVHEGWNTFTFATPWVRPNTTTNLVLTFDDNTGSYSSTSNWQATSGQTGTTLYAYGDGTNYDPASTSISFYTTDTRPNVVFVAPCADASCVPPSVTVTGTSSTSVTLNWVPGLTETAWTVEYRMVSDTAWTVALASTTAQTHTITGLYANTAYAFRVGSLCPVSSEVPYTTVAARTACAVMSRSSLPLFENFDSYSTGDLPNCWLAPMTGSSSSGSFPGCYNSSYNAYSGNIYFEMESSTGQTEIFALPAIDTIDGIEVIFYAAGYSYYAPNAFEVGVWEGDSVFLPLDTIDIDYSGYYTYRPYYVRINYSGTSNRIAFRTTGSSSYTLFIEDLTIHVPNPCDSVSNIVFDTIGMSRLSISWTDTAATGNYTVKIGTTNNPAAAFFTGTTTSTHYTFTGLSGITTYYVWVYANCSVGLSDPATASATTLASDPHFLPYFNTFEDTTDVFSVYQLSGTNTWYTGSAVSHDGSRSMYVTNDGGTTNAYTNTTQSISFAVTYIQIPYDSSYAISYDWRCQGEGSYDLMRLALVPEGYDFSSSFTSINRYSNTLPTGWIPLDGGKRNLRNTWQHDENSVRVDAGNYYLTLVWTNDNHFGSNPAAAIDNLSVQLLTCPAPEGLTASSATSHSIDVSWSAGAASSWIVEYGVSGFTRGMGTTTTVTTTNITLSGLAPTTSYDIYVRPICGATDSGFVAMVNCITGCDSVINNFPWVEDFEYGISCWEQYFSRGDVAWTTGNGGNAYGGIPGAATGQSNARFTCNSYNQYTTYLITPMLNIQSDEEVMMTFFHAQPAWGTDQDTLAVLYRTRPDSAWHYLASWNGNIDHWQADTVMLPNPTSTYQVAFMAHSGFGLGILLDSIVVYGSESCTRPIMANANVGSTSVTATWVSPAATFDVAIKPANASTWPAPTRITSHTFTFTGLEPSTAYNYRIRSICNDTSYSFWTTVNCITDTLVCYVPEELAIVDYDFQSVTITWDADVTNHALAYVVNVFNSAVQMYDTVYSNNATITGLYSDMNYNVRVRAQCSAATYSDWCEALVFSTSSCQPVADVAVSDVTDYSATVTWTPQGDATQWEVTYGYSGFNEGTGTSKTVNSPSATLVGLEYDTPYDVYVRSLCSDEVYSFWSQPVTFTTLPHVGINDVADGVNCTIYPNPATTETTITISGANGTVTITVVDMEGRTVATEDLSCSADCTKQMTLQSLAQGAYFVRIVGDNINMVRKLVVR